MVKYEYNPSLEGFQRVDRRGRVLPINIVEGRRIESLLNLGYSITRIFDEIDFKDKVTLTTVRTFVKNYREGNISLEGEFPIPDKDFEEVTMEVRLEKLERDVEMVKKMLEPSEKSWIRRLF